MISFKDYLTEARMAPLYHGTSMNNLDKIRRQGLMPFTVHTAEEVKVRPNLSNDEIEGISMTRSLTFAKERSLYQVVLELDHHQLAQKYRMLPFQYFSKYVARKQEIPGNLKTTRNEYEEFVITNKPIPFKYVTKVYVVNRLSNHSTIEKLRQQYGSSFIVTFD